MGSDQGQVPLHYALAALQPGVGCLGQAKSLCFVLHKLLQGCLERLYRGWFYLQGSARGHQLCRYFIEIIHVRAKTNRCLHCHGLHRVVASKGHQRAADKGQICHGIAASQLAQGIE